MTRLTRSPNKKYSQTKTDAQACACKKQPRDTGDAPTEPPAAQHSPTLSDLLDTLYRWLIRNLGLTLAKRLMLAALVVTTVVSCGWANRDIVAKLPVVSSVVTTVRQGPLPVVPANSNMVLVADLDDDNNDEMRDFFIVWMRQHHINSEPLGRGLHVPTVPTAESVQATETEAADFLVRTNAKVLLWGRVHHLGNQLVPEIHLVVAGREETPSNDPFYVVEDGELVSPRLQRDVAKALLAVNGAVLAQASQQQETLLRMVQQQSDSQ